MFRRAKVFTAVILFVSTVHASAVECITTQEDVFSGDGEHVRLAKKRGLEPSASFVVFKSRLRVNTDGAPNSYHPQDPLGEEKAINRFDNGIAVRSVDPNKKLKQGERLSVFKKWRDTNWQVPEGYKITWKNVIAADSQGFPCVFSSGQNKGYFGSLTALRNGLSNSEAGECLVNDQIDQRFVPAIVLRGGSQNPMVMHGAKVGDLVLAVNPRTNVAVAAVIGDTGDGKNIGEGSVALNMALIGQIEQPINYGEAKRLDTGDNSMVVAVFPRSKDFKKAKIYTRENIKKRVDLWALKNGYKNIDDLKESILECSDGL